MFGKDPLNSKFAQAKIQGIDPISAGLSIGGALLGSKGGGGGGSTTSLPKWMLPYIKGEGGVLPEAKRLYEMGGPQYFEGDTLADFSPEQLQAFDMIKGNVAGAALPQQAADLGASTMAGDFLGGERFMDAYGDDILDAVTSRFGLANRGGSAMEAQAATKELGDVASRLYGQERDRMMTAMAQGTELEKGRYLPSAMLETLGGKLQAQDQAQIGADMARWDYEQNLPWEQLQKYSNLVYGAMPGAGTQTRTSTNRMTGALGGAALGYGMGQQYGSSLGWGDLFGGNSDWTRQDTRDFNYIMSQ